MKAAKTKLRSKSGLSRKKNGEPLPHGKPALRSDAFARALIDAQACLKNRDTLGELLNAAAKKAAAVPREPFKECWPYLQTMLRLVRAQQRGDYNEISENALLWVVAALKYLIDPFDFIPDKTPVLGFIDDAAVVEFVTDKTRQTLDEFMTWETTAPARQ